MIQKVLQIGSSVGVVIPKASLLELGVELGDEVTVEVNKKTKILSIRLQTKASKRRERIAELTFNFIDRYRKDLQALAKA